MAEPALSLMRPVVMGPLTQYPIALETALKPIIQSKVRGAVLIAGGPGTGKSSAIEYLRRVEILDPRICLLDEPDPCDLEKNIKNHLIIFTGPIPWGTEPFAYARLSIGLTRENRAFVRHPSGPEIDILQHFRLASWGSDEWIEYLLTRHRAQCNSVMRRVSEQENAGFISGSPLLSGIVLDAFASNESLTSAVEAVREFARSTVRHSDDLNDARTAALNMMFKGDPEPCLSRLASRCAHDRLARAILLPSVQCALACDRIIYDLLDDESVAYFVQKLDPVLIAAVGEAVRERPTAYKRLVKLISRKRHAQLQPTVASMLVAADLGWKPGGRFRPKLNLIGADLPGAKWSGASLAKNVISKADLTGADLAEANLDRAFLNSTLLTRARLDRSSLCHTIGTEVNLERASLKQANACFAGLPRALLVDADCEGANMEHAILSGADLSRTRFVRANLLRASLIGAKVDETDFSAACLQEANLGGLDLRSAQLHGADMRGACLAKCRLDDQTIPGAKMSRANLEGADMTGTRIPHGDLRAANLRNCGLAEVDWEHADLRNADFREASFHAGSSRSGRVGSPIASEGTRTGFYTDEFDEQLYRPPEDIRKANLCGADLRGAIVDRTDFYLVDLRRAQYDEKQAEHFRRCGAILQAKVV